MNLFDLYAKITIDTGEYERGLTSAQEKTLTIGTAIKSAAKTFAAIGTAVAATGTAVYSFASRVAESGDNIDKMSQKLGMSAESYQEWSHILEHCGTSIDSLQTGMKTLASAAETGSAAFEKLGLSQEKISGLSQEELFSGTIEALQNVASETERTYLAGQLLGRGATELGALLNTSAEEIADMRQNLHDMGAVMSDEAVKDCAAFQDSLTNLKAAASGVANGLASGLIPKITSLMDTITDFAAGGGLEKIIDGFSRMVPAITGVATVLVGAKIGNTIQSIAAGFQVARLQLSLYTLENGKAAIASATLNGTLSVGEIVAGVLTGKISLATAAQAAWNAAMSANPIGLVTTAVALLTAGIVKLSKAQDKLISELAGTAETSEEAAAKVDELKQKIEALEATDPGFWGEMQQVEYDNLRLALAEAESQYESLKKAEEAAAAEAATPAARAAAATEEFAESVTALFDQYQETYTAIFESVEKWFSPFEEAKTTVTTSIEKMMAAMQSQIDFNAGYSANLQSLAQYGLGSLSSYFQTLGADGAAYAETIVSAVETAGGASSEGGQEIIAQFQALAESVEGSQADVASSLTTLSGDFAAAVNSMVDSLASGIEGLDKGEEAFVAAKLTMSEYLAGVDSQIPGILEAMTSLGEKITAALQAGMGSVSLPSFTGGGYGGPDVSVGHYATGLDYVPYDEFPAYLHRGEMVVPAKEAELLRQGIAGGKVVNLTINSPQLAKSDLDYIVQAVNRELGSFA